MRFSPVLAGLLAIAAVPASDRAAMAADCRCGTLSDEAVAARSGWRMDWIVQLPFDSTRFKLVHVTDDADLVVAQSGDGGVHAIVAAKGPRRGTIAWSRRVGEPDGEILPAAIGSNVVAVAAQRSLYGLRTDDGSVAFAETANNFFGAGPAVAGDSVFQPTAGGGILKVAVDPVTMAEPPIRLASHGSLQSPPFVLAGDGAGWINGAGELFELMPLRREPGGFKRSSIQLKSPAVGRPITLKDGLLVATQVGDLVRLERPRPKPMEDPKRPRDPKVPEDVRALRVRWRLPLPGRPDGGMIFDDGVIFVSLGVDGIVAVSDEAHSVLWRLDKPMKLLAAGAGRLWCLDTVGRLLLLDAETGDRVACSYLDGLSLPVVSSQPGRLLLASPEGLLASLSPIDAGKPDGGPIAAPALSSSPGVPEPAWQAAGRRRIR